MRFAAVLFDLDGTLVDTAPDFIVVLNAMLRDRGLVPLAPERIREEVSNGVRALVALGFGRVPGDEGYEALAVELRERYARHLAVHSTLFPGLDDLLGELEGRRVPWGIVTNKPSVYTLPLLDALQLSSRCSAVVCPDQVTHTKPHPEPMFKACAQLGVDPARCVYVGDHDRDIAAGRNAGMTTVAAAWGYIGRDEDPLAWQPDVLCRDAAELARFLFTH